MKQINIRNNENSWLPIFFGIAACSWVPHWACHYYRIETESSFVVGDFEFGVVHSVVSLFLYSCLIAINLASISLSGLRFFAALISGILHLTLAFIHISRIINPFHFEVFGYYWSLGSTIREVLFIFPFGMVCIAVSFITSRRRGVV